MVLIVTNKKLFSSAPPGSAIICCVCVVASIEGGVCVSGGFCRRGCVCVCVGVYVLDWENKGQSTIEKVQMGLALGTTLCAT